MIAILSQLKQEQQEWDLKFPKNINPGLRNSFWWTKGVKPQKWHFLLKCPPELDSTKSAVDMTKKIKGIERNARKDNPLRYLMHVFLCFFQGNGNHQWPANFKRKAIARPRQMHSAQHLNEVLSTIMTNYGTHLGASGTCPNHFPEIFFEHPQIGCETQYAGQNKFPFHSLSRALAIFYLWNILIEHKPKSSL